MVSAWRDGGEAGVDRWLDIAAASFGPRWRNPVGEFQGGSFVPAATLQRPLWLRQCGVVAEPVSFGEPAPGRLGFYGALCRSDGLRRVWACLLLKRLWLLRESWHVERGAALKAGALRFCRRALRGAAVEAAAFRDCGWDMAASGDGLRPVAAKKSH